MWNSYSKTGLLHTDIFSNFLVLMMRNFTKKFSHLKADFQSVEFSERAEILLFARENVALKLNG